MNIKVERWITEEGASYKILGIEKCCDKLVNSENICLNYEFSEDDSYEDEKEYSAKIIRKERDYDGFADYFYEKISFCPFCGKQIKIEIVNEVDKTEEYKFLRNERNALWEKSNKTDSKKKSEELKRQMRELDCKIDNMLKDDDFKRD